MGATPCHASKAKRRAARAAHHHDHKSRPAARPWQFIAEPKPLMVVDAKGRISYATPQLAIM